MDELRKRVLLEHRESLVQSADFHDVFLDKLLDHLTSKSCIQRDQTQLIKSPPLARTRVGVLVDFVSTEGQRAFEELCNALDKFGTENTRELAESLRRSLGQKRDSVSDYMTRGMELLRKKVLLDHRESFVNAADDQDLFLDRLLDHLTAKQCMQRAHKQIIKRTLLSQTRMGIFIDFVASEGQREFDELCNALDMFGTEDKRELADSLRRSLGDKLGFVTCNSCEYYKNELLKQREEYEIKLAAAKKDKCLSEAGT